ncbi:unnamed protein product [Moneuplotes crassus]|uniref:Uncharacterized protein n=1 Tax=Euplotes crassus TaxID=5936 RepID=A0AAD1XZ76_EUPCR|nr:unnamed protein product [Moneuplotes crassus]
MPTHNLILQGRWERFLCPPMVSTTHKSSEAPLRKQKYHGMEEEGAKICTAAFKGDKIL